MPLGPFALSEALLNSLNFLFFLSCEVHRRSKWLFTIVKTFCWLTFLEVIAVQLWGALNMSTEVYLHQEKHSLC